MERSVKLRAPELLRPRLEVLKSGLSRLENGDEEGLGTVRRMGEVFLNWASGEDLAEIEKSASSLVGAKDKEVLETGHTLKVLLENLVANLGPSDSEGLMVLCVEENPDDALLLETALAASDRVLNIVPTTAEAEEFLENEEIALLVLDLTLPDGDGRTLLAQTREQTRHRELTIFVVSGKTQPEVKAECMALGANGFFEKPFDPNAIRAAANSALHKEAKRRASVHTDSLTHLLNRNSIRELWERWTFPDPSSIGILGIDNFRGLEERLDHEIADGIIASVGDLIRTTVPRGTVSARWEESQFLFLCPGQTRGKANKLVNGFITGIRKLEHRDPRGETFSVTASGGVVEIARGISFDDAVEEASDLLDQAADSGGNTLAESMDSEDGAWILLAEDDPLSAGILVHRLEKEGFKVLHCLDGAQALKGALSNRIAMAILDVKMPEMDGFELLDRLRKVPAFYDLPIMMLTSMGREEDVARGFELGADDYMVKPFSPVEVLARVRRLLNR
jgi:two-component system cell cycle response regulator